MWTEPNLDGTKGPDLWYAHLMRLYLSRDFDRFCEGVQTDVADGMLDRTYLYDIQAHSLAVLPPEETVRQMAALDPLELREVLRALELLQARTADDVLGLNNVYRQKRKRISMQEAMTMAAAYHVSPYALLGVQTREDIPWYNLSDFAELTPASRRNWMYGSAIVDGVTVGVTTRLIRGWLEVSIMSTYTVPSWVSELHRIRSKIGIEVTGDVMYLVQRRPPRSRLLMNVYQLFVPVHKPEVVYVVAKLLNSTVDLVLVDGLQHATVSRVIRQPWQNPGLIVEWIRPLLQRSPSGKLKSIFL